MTTWLIIGRESEVEFGKYDGNTEEEAFENFILDIAKDSGKSLEYIRKLIGEGKYILSQIE